MLEIVKNAIQSYGFRKVGHIVIGFPKPRLRSKVRRKQGLTEK
jgi:hypothetical protein